MTRHFLRSVEMRGERLACLQFRKVIDYYARSFGPCKPLRLAMKELSQVDQYHDLVGQFLTFRRASDERRAGQQPLPAQPLSAG